MESLPDATFVVDERGSIVFANRVAKALFWYPREALVGQPIEVLVPDGLRERHRDHRRTYAGAAFPSEGAAAPQPQGTAAPTSAGGSETILVADDDAGIRRATRRALERQGYVVLMAADGEEALELFREPRDRIRLVLSDLVMPGLGGRQLAEALRVAGRGAPRPGRGRALRRPSASRGAPGQPSRDSRTPSRAARARSAAGPPPRVPGQPGRRRRPA